MTTLLNGLLGVIVFLLVIGPAIFIHELGHFLFARLRGIGVDEFAIGMGPKIVSWRRHGTDYSLRWFPVGGFVRLHQMVREEAEDQNREDALAAMAEEEEAESPPTAAGAESATATVAAKAQSLGEAAHEDMAALYDKGLVTKLLVFGGGVFFNFLMAIAAVTALFAIGWNEPTGRSVWVGDLKETSPLWVAGLRSGDVFTEIEGMKVADEREIDIAMSVAFGDDAKPTFVQKLTRKLFAPSAASVKPGSGADGLDVVVRREDKEVALKLPPLDKANKEVYFGKDGEDGLKLDAKPYIGGVVPFDPADKAGIKEGDLIVQIDDTPVKSWDAVAKIIHARPRQPMTIQALRRGATEPLSFKLVSVENTEDPKIGQIGIMAGSGEKKFTRESFPVALKKAPGRAVEETIGLAVMNFKALTETSFKGLKKNVGGPVAIASMTYKQWRKGWDELLFWFFRLNLLLAIMNLLPLPILDGGFILLAFMEAIARRPVPTRVLTPIFTTFAFLLIGLFAAITFNDILRFF